MAVAVVKEIKGVPPEAINAVLKTLGLNPDEPGSAGYPGSLSCVFYRTDEGLTEVEVFETPEQAQANIEVVINATTEFAKAAGLTPDPDMMVINVREVHTYFGPNPAG